MNTLKAEKRSMDIKAKKLRREGYVVGNKDVAYNPVAGRIDEIDFQALVSTEKVHSVVEVVLENHDKIAEGVLQESLEEIAYKALPADLVDEVRVDVGDMKIGDVIRVKDLPIYYYDRSRCGCSSIKCSTQCSST